MKPTLVIMAAGMGSRYGGLKQIEPVGPNGEIIMDYSIYDALESGFGKVVFIIKHEIEESFKNKLGRRIEKVTDVTYVYQEIDSIIPSYINPSKDRIKPWGTGHAVLCCKDYVETPFAVINADDFYGKNSFRIISEFLKNVKDDKAYSNFGMVGFELSKTLSEKGQVARGICEADENDFLKSIVELTGIERVGDEIKHNGDITLKPDSIVSLNTWGFTNSIFGELEKRFISFLEQNKDNPKAEFFLPTVVDDLIRENLAKVKILQSGERWYGVTYKEDKENVMDAIKNYIAKGIYPENLWES